MANLQLAHNAVAAKLVDPPRDLALFVSGLLSYRVAGCEQMASFASGHWDGRSTFYDLRLNRFPAGFVPAVAAELQKQGHTVQLIRNPLPAPRGPRLPIVDEFGHVDPRYDYQMKTVERALDYGSMVAQVATGGGKSRIAQLATARILRPTLFLTTRGVLMYQMHRHFEGMLKHLVRTHGIKVLKGHRCGILGDGVWSPQKLVNVGMVQTFAARLKEPSALDTKAQQNAQAQVRAETMALLNTFEFVILEEAHEAGSNSFYDILGKCRNANYRLSLTATPFMRDDEEDNMRLMACSGPIGSVISEKSLIDRGILAKPYFKFMPTARAPRLFRTSSYPKAYKIGIVENDARNRQILSEMVRASSNGLSVIALVQRKDHGKKLLEMARAAGLRAEFIFGEHDQAERDAALKRFKAGRTQVLIGSTILDVGVDVPAVGMIILAGGGKAEVALRQRIGRGLRAKSKGPNVAFIVDFQDEHNQHLKGHAAQRREYISQTDGFREGILLANTDFDYSRFTSTP